jgi:hypothetical protein
MGPNEFNMPRRHSRHDMKALIVLRLNVSRPHLREIPSQASSLVGHSDIIFVTTYAVIRSSIYQA